MSYVPGLKELKIKKKKKELKIKLEKNSTPKSTQSPNSYHAKSSFLQVSVCFNK